MEAKHTPAPWKIYDANSSTLHIGTVSSDPEAGWKYETICNLYEDVTPEDSVTIGNWYDLCSNAKANASLIAAAPKLLKALQDCEARLALLVQSGRSKMLDAVAAENARAVIAEATRSAA